MSDKKLPKTHDIKVPAISTKKALTAKNIMGPNQDFNERLVDVIPFIDPDSTRFIEWIWAVRNKAGKSTYACDYTLPSNLEIPLDDLAEMVNNKFENVYHSSHYFRGIRLDKNGVPDFIVVIGNTGNSCMVVVAGERDEVKETIALYKEKYTPPKVININQLTGFAQDGSAMVKENQLQEDEVTLAHDEFYPWIENGIDAYVEKFRKSKANVILLIGPPGTGKAQPLDSYIKTPKGWGLMGDVRVGNVITAPDGTTTKVTGVFPQGLKDIFRVTFEDGRYTECCSEHLWNVYCKEWYSFEGKYKTLTLNEIEKIYKMPTYKNRLYVPLPIPIESEDVDLPIDPYFLGVLLGDGYLSTKNPSFSNTSDYIINKMKEHCPSDITIKTSDNISHRLTMKEGGKGYKRDNVDFFQNLSLLGLRDVRSETKFIPNQYLNSSPQQILSLLQGLLDTDGYVCLSGSIEYVTVSETLALQVQYLIRSLGGLCKISTKEPTYSYMGKIKYGQKAYRLKIRYHTPKSLFTFPFKRDRLSENYQYKESLKLRIKSIEYVGRKEAQCITVDHPKQLYITDNFIVTHNSCFLRTMLFKLNAKHIHLVYNEQTLMNPAFVHWLESVPRHSAIAIEDADTFVSKREEQNYQMSALLNYVEGVIPNNSKVIISTNLGSLSKVDTALLRAGRNHDILEFKELSIPQAHKVRKAVGLPKIKFLEEHKELTLANALNYEAINGIKFAKHQKPKFGFQQ